MAGRQAAADSFPVLVLTEDMAEASLRDPVSEGAAQFPFWTSAEAESGAETCKRLASTREGNGLHE